MHAKQRTILRAQVTARMTVDERAELDRQADQMSLTPSQYARHLLVVALNGGNLDTRILLAEIWASKVLISKLQASISADTPITSGLIQSIIAEADAAKWEAADKRLLEARKGQSRPN